MTAASSTFDPATGEFTGVITDYIQFAADCLGNQELEFQLVGYDSKEAELDALKSGEIDMIFHFDQSPIWRKSITLPVPTQRGPPT